MSGPERILLGFEYSPAICIILVVVGMCYYFRTRTCPEHAKQHHPIDFHELDKILAARIFFAHHELKQDLPPYRGSSTITSALLEICSDLEEARPTGDVRGLQKQQAHISDYGTPSVHECDTKDRFKILLTPEPVYSPPIVPMPKCTGVMFNLAATKLATIMRTDLTGEEAAIIYGIIDHILEDKADAAVFSNVITREAALMLIADFLFFVGPKMSSELYFKIIRQMISTTVYSENLFVPQNISESYVLYLALTISNEFPSLMPKILKFVDQRQINVIHLVILSNKLSPDTVKLINTTMRNSHSTFNFTEVVAACSLIRLLVK